MSDPGIRKRDDLFDLVSERVYQSEGVIIFVGEHSSGVADEFFALCNDFCMLLFRYRVDLTDGRTGDDVVKLIAEQTFPHLVQLFCRIFVCRKTAVDELSRSKYLFTFAVVSLGA